jgi:hypothetical protein
MTSHFFRDEHEPEDDLSELQSEAVPEEVRKWLASTFAKQETTTRRSDERPSFRLIFFLNINLNINFYLCIKLFASFFIDITC